MTFRPGSLVIAVLIGIALAAPRAEAQGPNEAEIKRHFEGKRVTLRIDMPGASEGVDIRVDRPFDAKQYGDRLRRFGTSIRSGETATITTIKVKKDMVEFQLDGGGYGTFGDDTSLSVNMPDVQKTNREKDLEAAVKRETDAARKRELQREQDGSEIRSVELERAIAEGTPPGGAAFSVLKASFWPITSPNS